MDNIKLVMDYGNLNYFQALELPCDLFLYLVKKATIEKLESTEEGREYLEKCERMQQTSIDLKGLQKYK